ncbi:NIPSNAP family containing protein [Myxococcota bacterium]|nr:NIPSNAP family containing protein [Myxococcota bacterium]
MANDKIYIHEVIDIIGHNRARYMHHMTANWSPIAQVERNQLCFGVWGVVGSTKRWPEVVNLWEEDGLDGMASSFRHEFNHASLQNPSLAEWWAEAAKYRNSGVDRLLRPAPWTRTIRELNAAEIRGEAYAHEIVQIEPGHSPDYLDLVRDVGVGAYGEFDFELVGAFETLMVNDSECIVIWAIPSWEAWAEFERAQRSAANILGWRKAIRGIAHDWHRFLLVDSPLCPLRTGRQPEEGDRRPLDEI